MEVSWGDGMLFKLSSSFQYNTEDAILEILKHATKSEIGTSYTQILKEKEDCREAMATLNH